MLKINLLIPCFFLLLMVSCTKDPCRESICLNGGFCEDGTCRCAEGYSGEHCDIYDLCYQVVCPLGGPCENGECLPPRIVQISKIEVIRFPGVKQMGTPWDLGMPPDNAADIFPHILKNSGQVWWGQAFAVTNAIPGNVYSFFPNPPVNLSNPAEQYEIGLLDSDVPSPPETMGKIPFVPFSNGNGLPHEMVVDPGGPLAFRLTLNYLW